MSASWSLGRRKHAPTSGLTRRPQGSRADLRAIDRESALQILHCLDRYLDSRTGDVKRLKPPLSGFRLRCGDYRIFFDLKNENAAEITAVRHRKDAYR